MVVLVLKNEVLKLSSALFGNPQHKRHKSQAHNAQGKTAGGPKSTDLWATVQGAQTMIRPKICAPKTNAPQHDAVNDQRQKRYFVTPQYKHTHGLKCVNQMMKRNPSQHRSRSQDDRRIG
jgi:hypothetical protein